MGRPPIGKKAMSLDERLRRYWGKRLGTGEKTTTDSKLVERLETEIRDLKAKLLARKRNDREFERRVSDEVTRRFDKAFPSIQEQQNKAYEQEKTYREFLKQQRKMYTTREYTTILMCLHPDGTRTSQKLTEAFRLFRDKKFALTGEK